MLALLLALTQSPVTVQLNHDRYTTGDHARVYVQSAADGYLVVLHADPAGRVRVLFPVDPTDDAFIRGGRKFEVRGRGDRDAFQIEDQDGSGTVVAAVSADPLRFDQFVRNDHWDFRALGGPSSTVRDDPFANMLDIVQRMTGDSSGGGRFEYDAATYVVGNRRLAYYDYPYRYGGGYYDPFLNPYCFDPFWGVGCYGFGFGFGYPYGFGYRIGFVYGFGGRGWYFPYTRYRPFAPFGFTTRQPLYVIPTGRTRFTPTPVRPRTEFGNPTPARIRDLTPRVFTRPSVESRWSEPRSMPRVRSEPRASTGGGWSRPSFSHGGSGGSGRSSGGGGGGGGRRH